MILGSTTYVFDDIEGDGHNHQPFGKSEFSQMVTIAKVDKLGTVVAINFK